MTDRDLARHLGLTPEEVRARRAAGELDVGPGFLESPQTMGNPMVCEPVTEGHFQAAVISLAQRHGWRVAHFRKARTKKGWRTAVAADGKGFPDLVMVRAGSIIFAELKSKDGVPTKEQEAWLAALSKLVPCCEHCRVQVHLWRPADWPTIREVLASE